MKKYLVALALILPSIIFAQTATSTPDLQALIKQLQAQVAELQAQIQSIKTELRITRVLTQGATGDDVKQLQEFLKTVPGVYPEGLVTGYFGPLTKAAIQRFQEKQGIVNSGSSETTGFGVVGPRTISKINELINTGAGASGIVSPGLAPAGSTLPITPSVTGSAIPLTQTQTSATQAQTTSIAPTQSVTTTSVSNTTSNTATTATSSTFTTGAPSMSFGANPVTISAGQSSTLTLSSSGASGGCYGQGTFSGQISGSVTVSPATTTSYAVTCYGGPGQQSGPTTTVIPVVFVAPPITSGTSAIPTPQNFTMTGGVEAVTATWSAVNNVAVTGYKVLLTNTGANTTSVLTTNDTKKIFDGIAPGNYSAYVAAFDAAGNTSAPSPTAYATASSPSTPSYPPEVVALGKFTGFNGGGYGEDSTWCHDSNYGVSMWNDTAGTCRDKAGSYTDFCRASPYEWQKTGYGCTGDVAGTTWTNVRCTIGNNGFVGGSCSAGVISSAPPSPPPPSSTTSRAALQASILSSLNSLLRQLYELVR